MGDQESIEQMELRLKLSEDKTIQHAIYALLFLATFSFFSFVLFFFSGFLTPSNSYQFLTQDPSPSLSLLARYKPAILSFTFFLTYFYLAKSAQKEPKKFLMIALVIYSLVTLLNIVSGNWNLLTIATTLVVLYLLYNAIRTCYGFRYNQESINA
jgi:hypothetical protein